MIQIGGAQPAINSNWLGGMYASPVDQAGNPSASGVPEVLKPVYATKNGYGFVDTQKATIYTDPTSANAATATVKFGQLYTTEVGVELVSDGVEYFYIGGTSLGKAWIKKIDFRLIKSYDPAKNCDEPSVTGGVPEGANPLKTGPLEGCE